jgi:hypothetical protein
MAATKRWRWSVTLDARSSLGLYEFWTSPVGRRPGRPDRHRGGDSDIFTGAGDGEVQFESGGGADIDVQLGRDLRGHVFGYDVGGIIAGRKQVEGEGPRRR